MTRRTIKVIILSIIVGIYIAIEHYFLSGTFPAFGNALRVIILLLLVYGIFLVIKEPLRKQKIIQVIVLLIGIILGIIATIVISNSLRDDFPRRYYIKEVQ